MWQERDCVCNPGRTLYAAYGTDATHRMNGAQATNRGDTTRMGCGRRRIDCDRTTGDNCNGSDETTNRSGHFYTPKYLPANVLARKVVWYASGMCLQSSVKSEQCNHDVN